jgi:hypothetical protein
MGRQSRTWSFFEAVANVVLGYFVSLAAQLVIFPLFGMRVSLTDNLLIGMCFLIVSLARSYVLRRLFNARPARDPYAEPWA